MTTSSPTNARAGSSATSTVTPRHAIHDHHGPARASRTTAAAHERTMNDPQARPISATTIATTTAIERRSRVSVAPPI